MNFFGTTTIRIMTLGRTIKCHAYQNNTQHNDKKIWQSVQINLAEPLLLVGIVLFCYAVCCSAEFCVFVMLNVITLNVIMLSVVAPKSSLIISTHSLRPVNKFKLTRLATKSNNFINIQKHPLKLLLLSVSLFWVIILLALMRPNHSSLDGS